MLTYTKMKYKISEKIHIPDGVNCEFKDNVLTCKKGEIEIKRKIILPRVKIEIKDKEIIVEAEKANKNEHKVINALKKHIQNMFEGLNNKFVYLLESCNVHFPMTLKVEGKNLIINNFLGEKVPRKARILDNVNVQVKGKDIIVESHDKTAAGQTAANFEKATKIRNRDRRIFQDGIYIVERPGRKD